MIIQKFNSINDIDKEFIPSLEELLSDHIPSFDYLRSFESSANEDQLFAYYLFFSRSTNSPVGFAQANISETSHDKKESKFFNLFFKSKSDLPVSSSKNVRWEIPCASKDGVIFNPRYKDKIIYKTKEILQDFSKRKDVQAQEIFFSEIMSSLSDEKAISRPVRKEVAHLLFKNQSSYQDFINSLPKKSKELVLQSWKITHENPELKLGEYQSFKEIFQYKSYGATQYRDLKKNPRIKKFLLLEGKNTYLTLESETEIQVIVILTQGKNSYSFYETFILKETIAEAIPHQMAIMNFYDNDQAARLSFLGSKYTLSHFKDLGFTTKPQYNSSVI